MKRFWVVSLLLVVALLVGCQSESFVATESADWAAEAPMEVPVEVAPVAGNGTRSAVANIPDRMIIYNGNLALVVRDTLAAQEEIVTLIDELGGHVVSSGSFRYEGGLSSINMTLRVPAARFQETMTALRGLALEVTRDSISSEDVTQEYVDLDSRLRALEVKAVRLEELMDEAEDTEAVLAVYRELSATQQEIEQVKGRMQYLERSAAMATITVSLTPDELAQPIEIAGWRPAGTAKRAIEALIGAVQFLLDASIWIIIFVLPVLLVVGLVGYAVIRLIIFLIRRLRREEPAAA